MTKKTYKMTPRLIVNANFFENFIYRQPFWWSCRIFLHPFWSQIIFTNKFGFYDRKNIEFDISLVVGHAALDVMRCTSVFHTHKGSHFGRRIGLKELPWVKTSFRASTYNLRPKIHVKQHQTRH